MDPITIIALIIFVPISIIAYVQYRQGLNEKQRKANLEKRDYNKPTVIDDSKSCLSIIVIIIFGMIALFIVYAILHWLAPGLFPKPNVN